MAQAPNNRIFYACQAVAFGLFDETETLQSNASEAAHGVQSVGINTTFNLEQAFELGQISVYENIEGLPDVEVTVEKVLDGYPLLYHLATSGAADNSLVGRTKKRANVSLGVFYDDKEFISGVAPVQVFMSGMYLNSLSYTFPTDGPCTESVTLVGNTKTWHTMNSTYGGAALWNAPVSSNLVGAGVEGRTAWGKDSPLALGGIQRREDVIMASSIMPNSIFGVKKPASVGSPDLPGNNIGTNGEPLAHIQNITISTDLGREDILELGQKDPYYRAPTFPVEVTSEFEVIAISGDFIDAYSTQDSTPETRILVLLRDGSSFDLGTKNRLSSVNYTGGDAGGGNATITYSYSTFNDLTVSPPTIFNRAV
jgi:hypothetical protein